MRSCQDMRNPKADRRSDVETQRRVTTITMSLPSFPSMTGYGCWYGWVDGWVTFDDYDHRFLSTFFELSRRVDEVSKMKIISRWIGFFNLSILVKKSILYIIIIFNHEKKQIWLMKSLFVTIRYKFWRIIDISSILRIFYNYIQLLFFFVFLFVLFCFKAESVLLIFF